MTKKTYLVNVAFDNTNQTYTYKTDIEGIEVGERVIVDAPSTRFTTVTVRKVWEDEASIQHKPIVCRLVEATAEYRENLERLKELEKTKKELNNLVTKYNETLLFEMLAEKLPEAKALMDKLNQLEK